MSTDFNPYYKWLGIPLKDQPPHYYRLLGIEVFETDPEVIALAAEQRMLLVRQFQKGEYAVISQKLQKKIAAAKACLLDPTKKQEYDISLRLQLHVPGAIPPPVPPAPQKIPSPAQPPLPQNYPTPPPLGKSAPLETPEAEGSANPLVAVRESFDLLFKYLRHHKKMVSLVVKLVGATVVLLIILMIYGHAGALWTFLSDKTSDLVDKITGSSGETAPERQISKRTVPGARLGGPGSSTVQQQSEPPSTSEGRGRTSGSENSGISGGVVPPPGPDSGRASTPSTTPDSAGANGSAPGEAAAAPPNNVSAQPPAPAPEIISLKLPSGKYFKTRLFNVNLREIYELLADLTKEEQVVFLYYPNGHVYAFADQDRGVLNGVCMAFSDERQPLTYANYRDGERDGLLKIWNADGQRVYWCQYAKGVRNGFCCYFQKNQLRLLLEIDQDKVTGVHLCANGELEKSFDSLQQAGDDDNVQKLLDEVSDLEMEIKVNEALFKKQIKEEELRQRREKTGILNAQKRAAIQERLNLRALETQELIKNLRKCPNF
jgi:antitoxin component YwqK of YwqJK toxin-antitoxin module